jgi:hypothetical protein
MTNEQYQKRRDEIAKAFATPGTEKTVVKAIDTLFLDLLGQNEPLIRGIDQFKITENNKVVRNRVRSELRQIIGKGKS